MQKTLNIKIAVIVGLLLIAVYGIIGIPRSPADVLGNLKKNIHLGLDLRGGSHLVLQIQVQDAVKAEADQMIDRLKEEMKKQNVEFASIDRNDPKSIEEADKIQINIHGVPLNSTSPFRDMISSRFNDWILTPVSATDYRLNIRPTEMLALKKDTVERAIRTIENRVNSLGLTEASVQQHGRAEAEFEILVQLPGVDDPARVRQIMQTTAFLEVAEVKDGPFPSPEAAMSKYGGVLPLNSRILMMPARTDRGEAQGAYYVAARNSVITGRDLRNARPGRDEYGKWETDFTLTQDAAKRFASFTGSNVGNRLAIILDGKIMSAPTIQSRIEDQGRITGMPNEQEASDLALVLRAGSLPAGVVFEEERTVGPSLGFDSIRDGIIAGVVGLALVIFAMLVYYKRSGVNAVVALFLNAIILIAALSYLGAVLTLPGIAGVILTIGMAVDSNVLIFERIREELRAGKAIVAAVDAGFSKAFLTIIDTHVTTIVSCAFLFLFGTGPVKGFAVTLVIGLLANVFTAVFVSKVMFDWVLSRKTDMAYLSI
jgi:preprotein translocase subunit SecD